jgi:hypothetical protein
MPGSRDWLLNIGPGWRPLVKPLLDFAAEHKIPVKEVKEKLGGLRFYVDRGPSLSANDELDLLIEETTTKSLHTCEECGEYGNIAGDRRMKCFCPKHHRERDEVLKRWAAERNSP